MNKHLNITLLSLLTLSLGACAHHNMALEDARRSFNNASNDPAVKENAPVAMHDAEIALEKANKAESDGAEKEDVSHLADIARNRVEIARVESQKKLAENQYQVVSKNRADAVVAARTNEANDARDKSQMLENSNKRLENSAVENEAQATVLKGQATALTEKNEALAKELADLKMKPTARGMELTLKDTVFEFGKADLTVGARRDLEKISQQLKNATGRQIIVEGHTDSIGTDTFNDGLSQRRADAVRDVLIRDTDTSLVTARGLGKQYPIASNSTEAGRQQNRRVTIIVSSDGTTK